MPPQGGRKGKSKMITDTKYILKIKEEFIFNEWDKIVESKNNII